MTETRLSLLTLMADTGRLLTFRRTSRALAEHPYAFLAFGLFCTWIAGIGRYWDNLRATLFQHLGLGSVVYVFVLAAILWLICLPLRPRHGSYLTFLTFVSLTSPPALLYAIPVERFTSMAQAQELNAWFLLVVALWRMALLYTFLRRVAGFPPVTIFIVGTFPLTLIVIVLAALNLEHVVFNLMAGIAPSQQTPNDFAFLVVFIIAFVSIYAGPLLGMFYLFLAYHSRKSPDGANAAPKSPAAT